MHHPASSRNDTRLYIHFVYETEHWKSKMKEEIINEEKNLKKKMVMEIETKGKETKGKEELENILFI